MRTNFQKDPDRSSEKKAIQKLYLSGRTYGEYTCLFFIPKTLWPSITYNIASQDSQNSNGPFPVVMSDSLLILLHYNYNILVECYAGTRITEVSTVEPPARVITKLINVTLHYSIPCWSQNLGSSICRLLVIIWHKTTLILIIWLMR